MIDNNLIGRMVVDSTIPKTADGSEVVAVVLREDRSLDLLLLNSDGSTQWCQLDDTVRVLDMPPLSVCGPAGTRFAVGDPLGRGPDNSLALPINPVIDSKSPFRRRGVYGKPQLEPSMDNKFKSGVR